ncbi:DUF4349 domain-containing protein [Paenibacillus sp. DMB5]|uniref:DUF4349 domain-containing protein n=1 Tax=Paenibacillus sp. DMB5 TaxID=1780103 RepID=UPI00076CCB8A|nr:DUF4349 domain-containing protein [Paenibacillus sp. DMB5]KUP21349.1 hypothetical protein AWJ19_15645 [Paenibacillus sp. DMB5]
MRKWGLHYLTGLLVLAVILAGCGSGDNNSASDNAAANMGTASEASTEAAPVAEETMKYDSSANSDLNQTAARGGGEADSGGNNPAGKGGNSGQQASGSSAGTSGFSGIDVAAGLNKKLIYKANLTMEVEDYGMAQSEVRNLVTLAGGYIIGFTENMSDYEKGGNFVMKVPAAGFSPFLDKLEEIKNKGIQRSIEGQDVSEEYVDLESRLKAKQLMETQYINFMSKATKSSDLVAFANELGAIQESIEQIKGRMRYIDQNVSFSTVELRLYQSGSGIVDIQKKEQEPLLIRASDALSKSLHALSVMFQGLFVFLAAALPVLVVLAVIVAAVLFIRKKLGRGQVTKLERIRAGRTTQRELPGHSTGSLSEEADPLKEEDEHSNK